MRIYTETRLENFEFWSGAKYLADRLTSEEFDIIEDTLEEVFPDGLSETEINDMFWFDDEFICNCIGYEDIEEFMKERD